MRRSTLAGLRTGALVYLLFSTTIATAAAVVPPGPAATAPAEAILLWPAGAPGSEGKTGSEVVTNTDGYHRVSGIHKPTLIPYLPARAGATGAAVIVMPGGGHKYLAIDNEGHAVAAWLSGHGVAAFVLKYRLAREEGSTYKVDVHALADAQRAVRLVRSRAKTWGIDPARVGVLGFSAGGQLATYAATRFEPSKADAPDPINRQSDRPSFAGLVYPGGPLAEIEPPKETPPAFLCAAADDKGPTRNALALFQKLREGGVDAELHIYAHGGHGFGMKDRPLPVTAWATRFHEWLGDEGFLRPPVPTTTTAAAPAPTAK